MAILKLNDQNAVFYRYTEAASAKARTFVFFNALTGDSAMWEGVIGERLRARGHGTLSFNYRGQADSPYGRGVALDAQLIVSDARELIGHLRPRRVVLCGLSIGGLFAARAWLDGLAGVSTSALVLINTLRRAGPRLSWINDALVRCAEVGGLELFRDLYAPLLFNEDWLAANRANFLTVEQYTPITADSGHYNLLKNGGSADWDLPYEELRLPVLVVTGLQDRVFLDLRDVAALTARLPSARRIDMPDAAHLLPAERPDQLAEVLLEFSGAI